MSKKLSNNAKVLPVKKSNSKSKQSKSTKSTATTNAKLEPNANTNGSAQSSTSTIIMVVENKPQLSEEELKIFTAATKIQCAWRRYKAKCKLVRLKKEKQDLDEKIQKLEQEAYIQIIKLEQGLLILIIII